MEQVTHGPIRADDSVFFIDACTAAVFVMSVRNGMHGSRNLPCCRDHSVPNVALSCKSSSCVARNALAGVVGVRAARLPDAIVPGLGFASAFRRSADQVELQAQLGFASAEASRAWRGGGDMGRSPSVCFFVFAVLHFHCRCHAGAFEGPLSNLAGSPQEEEDALPA